MAWPNFNIIEILLEFFFFDLYPSEGKQQISIKFKILKIVGMKK